MGKLLRTARNLAEGIWWIVFFTAAIFGPWIYLAIKWLSVRR